MWREEPEEIDLESRYGFRFPLDRGERSAPGLFGFDDLTSSRGVMAVLTVLYVGVFWLVPRGALLATFGYFFLTWPRWKEHDLRSMLSCCALLSVFWDARPEVAQAPPLVQLAFLWPLVLICILPRGYRFQFAVIGRRMGRTPFILLSLPFLIVIWARYWSDLGRLLREAKVLAVGSLDTASWLVGGFAAGALIAAASARTTDVTANRRIVWTASGIFLVDAGLRCVAPSWLALTRNEIGALDVLIVAQLLALGILPSREEQGGSAQVGA